MSGALMKALTPSSPSPPSLLYCLYFLSLPLSLLFFIFCSLFYLTPPLLFFFIPLVFPGSLTFPWVGFLSRVLHQLLCFLAHLIFLTSSSHFTRVYMYIYIILFTSARWFYVVVTRRQNYAFTRHSEHPFFTVLEKEEGYMLDARGEKTLILI